MKVLVTGGAGFIASHIVDAYVERGHEVTVVDDLSSGRKENVNPKAELVVADLRDPRTAEQLSGRGFDLSIGSHGGSCPDSPSSIGALVPVCI